MRLNLPAIRLPKPMRRGLVPLMSLAALSLVGAGLMYACWLRPAQDALLRAEQAYQAAKQTQATLQRTKARQVQAQVAQQQLDLAKGALPKQEEFTSLAMTLAELGKHEQVLIPRMGYDIKKPEEGRLVKATMAFKATGDYAAIYRFLHRLETTESYLVIERLDVGSEHNQKDSAGRVIVNITVATYLRQEPRGGTTL